MPVVNADGLVGRISEVGATWSKVIALIDSSMNVSVMVERTRDSGMVRGLLQAGNSSDTLELYYLPSDSDLIPGIKSSPAVSAACTLKG
jgi:rod shape-determining protein MreC